MRPLVLPRIASTLRAKILMLVLALSLVALIITGYFAFSAITDVGAYAQGRSQELGEGIANDSSAALLTQGQGYLVRIASDQAQMTDVLFDSTEIEMNILSAQAAQFQQNAPIRAKTPAYLVYNQPADPQAGAVLVFAPGATATPESDEAQTLSGLSDALKSVYTSDVDIASIYIATDSGMMLKYPGQVHVPANYDPRLRTWYTEAVAKKSQVWSDAPYVDADNKGLIMTCSQAVTNPVYGHWVIAADISTKTINEDFIGPTPGIDGYAVLLNQNGDIISRPGLSAGTVQWDQPFNQENAFSDTDPGIADIASNMTAGETGIGTVWFNGTETYVAYAPVSSMNWSLAVSLPVSQITRPVSNFTGKIEGATTATGTHIASQTGRLTIVFVLLFVAILFLVLMVSVVLSREIARPVAKLKEGALAIGKGNLDYRVNIRSGDEFEDLAGSFNKMAGALKENLKNLQKTTAEKERYSREMEIARSIQTSFLPEKMPVVPGFDLSAVMIPAMEVGGDFYDIVPLRDGHRWMFVIADVSGKGVSAALFMAMSRTLIRTGLENSSDAARVFSTVNDQLFKDTQSCMFVTMFAAALDPKGRTLDCINAGHNPPLLIRGKDGRAEFLHAHGIALGVVPGMDKTGEQIRLEPGDLFIMYTDGVTEAFDDRYSSFGEDSLVRIAQESCHLPADAVRDRIIEEIRRFTNGALQSDDITLVIIRVL